jgi:hypothetical protein
MANERMGKEDGGLARYNVNCLSGVDWENTSVVAKESGLRQRKVKGGIESLREIHRGMKVLNSFESLTVWRPILDRYFDKTRVRVQFSLKLSLRRTNVKLVCTRDFISIVVDQFGIIETGFRLLTFCLN